MLLESTASVAAPAPPAGSPQPPRLELPPYRYAAAAALERALGVSHPLAQILVRRGLDHVEAARAWLDADVRHPWSTLPGIDAASALILAHLRPGARITVHGDYDVDGVCATAIALRALRRLAAAHGSGTRVDWLLPTRSDGYGLSSVSVERLATRGTTLLVAVDCGVTAVEPVARARALGLDVVVADHHAPPADGRLPDAAVVHPALGGYGCPELCAAAVAHKLAQALLAAGGLDPALADAELDLVGLATIADVVALRDENRRLAREGLRALAGTRRPGLRALMAVARTDPSGLDERAVAFRLAPRLNAAGRLHRADAALELLLCDDEARAREVAAELDAANAERQQVETQILFAAERQVAEMGPRAAYVLAQEGWHPGVIGIVAARIAERYHRPTVLVALDGERGTGSGRSIAPFDLLGGLAAAGHTLEGYGGHRAAAGLQLARERLEDFRRAFEAHAAAALAPEDLVPVQRVDAVVAGAELGLGLAQELARLAPFGAGNPQPTLLLPAAALHDVRPMGEGRHARLIVSCGGVRCAAVAFGARARPPRDLDVPYDACAGLEVETYAGAMTPRLVLRGTRPCMSGELRVLGQPDSLLDAALREVAARRAPATARGERDDGFGEDGRTAPASAASAGSPSHPCGPRRVEVDRRELGVAGAVADLVATGGGVLVVCADVARRLRGLRERLGGFALCSFAALERDPRLGAAFEHVVAIDPPASARQRAALLHPADPDGAGAVGWAHLAWGRPELEFARLVHEAEHDLRPALVCLYRTLRERGGAAGDELEALLRGVAKAPEEASGSVALVGSAARAGRLLCVLEELGLITLDARAPATVTLRDPIPTALERSATFRATRRRLKDGRAFLSTALAPAA